jgi:hypothetical protein
MCTRLCLLSLWVARRRVNGKESVTDLVTHFPPILLTCMASVLVQEATFLKTFRDVTKLPTLNAQLAMTNYHKMCLRRRLCP